MRLYNEPYIRNRNKDRDGNIEIGRESDIRIYTLQDSATKHTSHVYILYGEYVNPLCR